MIVVRVELWPFGDKSKKQLIGSAHIANIGGDHEFGDYKVASVDNGTRVPWKHGAGRNHPIEPTRTGAVTYHDRKDPVLTLVRKALVAMGY